MTAPGHQRLRQNRRLRTAASALIAVAVIGKAIAYWMEIPFLQGACGIPLVLGLILLSRGNQASVADDFIKIGFTTIPKNRITRVDIDDDSMCVHWTGKKSASHSYLFRSAPYHPDDWKLLQDHLGALGVSRFDERHLQPVEY